MHHRVPSLSPNKNMAGATRISMIVVGVFYIVITSSLLSMLSLLAHHSVIHNEYCNSWQQYVQIYTNWSMTTASPSQACWWKHSSYRFESISPFSFSSSRSWEEEGGAIGGGRDPTRRQTLTRSLRVTWYCTICWLLTCSTEMRIWSIPSAWSGEKPATAMCYHTIPPHSVQRRLSTCLLQFLDHLKCIKRCRVHSCHVTQVLELRIQCALFAIDVSWNAISTT